jgi:regulatory protein
VSGDDESMAPVIPLFGGSRKGPDPVVEGDDAARIVPRRTGESGLWRSTWDSPGDNEVEPLAESGVPSDSHPARGGLGRSTPRLRALRPHGDEQGDADDPVDPESLRQSAEEVLVRRLRTRSLSISEARAVLKGYEQGTQRLDASQIEDLIDDFCRRGYLDDAILAGHLVTSGVERKGQGRVALARALAQRGIPRDVIDAALDDLPDDDMERALEYARTKMRSLARLDQETAKRRLSGQLARRGYSGGVVSAVVRTVMGEQHRGRPSGVRFE